MPEVKPRFFRVFQAAFIFGFVLTCVCTRRFRLCAGAGADDLLGRGDRSDGWFSFELMEGTYHLAGALGTRTQFQAGGQEEGCYARAGCARRVPLLRTE